ncbi:glycoside hydrolase family 57 protein [Pseudochryseolinea flava]|uniref:Alpha-amylase n=1 Tax=Pseudochryseolinea flava TaxID=2059302 RepID=A0A364Y524_9BACT|nr:glycoside hydrolase family 57 protein [Pseudochryseolinea flava]RAW00927.1 alpha-amylase [Pseudochryseolinea flava]
MMKSQSKTERSLVLYFQVHQPRRLSPLNFFDIGSSGNYFNDDMNAEIVKRIAHDCYIPTNEMLLKVLKKYPQLKITFSISGITIDQFEAYAPEALLSFKQLVDTGSVEILSETYYHSLSSLMIGDEFESQIIKHAEKIYEHFQVRPHVFRNTELMYDNEIGKRISMLGYQGVITEGIDAFANGKGVNHIYQHPEISGLKILLRNYRLSDDIAFRFKDFKITADKFLSWLNEMPAQDEIVTLGMDYETFGEHHKQDSGIQKFLEKLLVALGKQTQYRVITPTEAVRTIAATSPLSVSETISWADTERDVSAWLGNDMQRDAFYTVTKMEQAIKNMGEQSSLEQWRHLLTSDHFYYMSTKKNTDGKVHSYFSPYPSPYEAFINFMNVIADFSIQAKNHHEASLDKALVTSEQDRHKQLEVVPTWAMTVDQDHYTPYRH